MAHSYPGGWYDQTLPDNQPVSQPVTDALAAKSAASAARPPRRWRKPGMKAVTITVCVLILIVASVYAFSDRSNLGRLPAASVPTAEPDNSYAEDFRQFFENYYSTSGAGSSQRSGSQMQRRAGDPDVTVELVSAAERPELSLGEIYDAGIRSIIGIKTGSAERIGYSWGSGIILTEDGYILTNQHIVEGAEIALVLLPDGRELESELVGEDIQTDLAVLKVNARGLTPVEFGDSAALHVGDRVAAIGNPLGTQFSGTLTDGIVSGFRQDVTINGRTMTLLQTNAAINEGSSGGPLYNMYGQVVGITNMKMVNFYSATPIEGMGFAIPSTVIKTVADQLIAGGKISGRPMLGLSLGAIPAEAAEHYSLPEGLYVHSVFRGGDAMEKGIRAGDIVTHIDGKAVTSTSEVLEMRNALEVGDTMVLTVWRNGEELEIPVVLRDQNQIEDKAS